MRHDCNLKDFVSTRILLPGAVSSPHFSGCCEANTGGNCKKGCFYGWSLKASVLNASNIDYVAR